MATVVDLTDSQAKPRIIPRPQPTSEMSDYEKLLLASPGARRMYESAIQAGRPAPTFQLLSWKQVETKPTIREAYQQYHDVRMAELLHIESETFYQKLGYPQYGGKYSPFDIPTGTQVKSIEKTDTGLTVEFEAFNRGKYGEPLLLGWAELGYPEYSGYQVPAIPPGYRIKSIEVSDSKLSDVSKLSITLEPISQVDKRAPSLTEAILNWRAPTLDPLHPYKETASPIQRIGAGILQPIEYTVVEVGKWANLYPFTGTNVKPVPMEQATIGSKQFDPYFYAGVLTGQVLETLAIVGVASFIVEKAQGGVESVGARIGPKLEAFSANIGERIEWAKPYVSKYITEPSKEAISNLSPSFVGDIREFKGFVGENLAGAREVVRMDIQHYLVMPTKQAFGLAGEYAGMYVTQPAREYWSAFRVVTKMDIEHYLLTPTRETFDLAGGYAREYVVQPIKEYVKGKMMSADAMRVLVKGDIDKYLVEPTTTGFRSYVSEPFKETVSGIGENLQFRKEFLSSTRVLVEADINKYLIQPGKNVFESYVSEPVKSTFAGIGENLSLGKQYLGTARILVEYDVNRVLEGFRTYVSEPVTGTFQFVKGQVRAPFEPTLLELKAFTKMSIGSARYWLGLSVESQTPFAFEPVVPESLGKTVTPRTGIIPKGSAIVAFASGGETYEQVTRSTSEGVMSSQIQIPIPNLVAYTGKPYFGVTRKTLLEEIVIESLHYPYESLGVSQPTRLMQTTKLADLSLLTPRLAEISMLKQDAAVSTVMDTMLGQMTRQEQIQMQKQLSRTMQRTMQPSFNQNIDLFKLPSRKKGAWSKRYMWEFPVKGPKELWKVV